MGSYGSYRRLFVDVSLHYITRVRCSYLQLSLVPQATTLDQKVADLLVVDLQDGQRDRVVHLFVLRTSASSHKRIRAFILPRNSSERRVLRQIAE